jgi:hypothetical protein
MQPPPLALNAPLEQGGPGRRWGRCAHTLGRPSGHRLALVGCWLSLESSPPVSQSSFEFEWAFAFVLLKYAFWKAHFGEFLYLCQQNIFIPKLVEMLVAKLLFYVLVFIFPLLCSNFDGINVR